MSDCGIYGNKNWQRAVDKASDKPAATVHGTGSGEAKGGDRSLCANCGVLIIFGGTDPLYRHKHWVHVERENENDEREYVNCAVPDNPHYLVAVPTPPASPTITLDRETLVTLLEIVPQFPPSTRYGKAFEDAISRLRAAERQK